MLLFTIQNSDSRDPMHSARNLIGPLTNCKLLNQVTVLFEIGIVFFFYLSRYFITILYVL